MSRRRLVVAAAALALVAAGLSVIRPHRFEPPVEPGRPATGASGPSSPAAHAAEVTLPAMAASTVSAATGAATLSEADQALAQRMKSDWCGFRAPQAQQSLSEGDKSPGPAGQKDTAAQIEAVSSAVLDEAREQARQRLAGELRRRGDLRSLALADFLLGDGSAGMRLQRFARSSTDPLVTALALQRQCVPGDGCINVDPAQWSRLEPANLFAWLTLMQSMEKSQQGYALERAASQTSYSRSYMLETFAQLMTLPLSASPGLAAQAELEMLMGFKAAWALPGYRPLLGICRSSAGEPLTVTHCSAVADLLWRQDSQIERGIAIAIARAVLPSQPELRAVWERRARAYEAVAAWGDGSVARTLERLWPNDQALASHCGALPVMREMLQETTERGDWTRAVDEMRNAGHNQADWAARWRQKAGRSALEPPVRASAASR